MPRPSSNSPTDGELEILNHLWEGGPLELGALCARIRENRPVATTTVATMLKIMLDKRLVTRLDGERGYRWKARLSRTAANRGLVRRLLDAAFQGSAEGLVSHLLQDGELSEQERRAIERLLRQPPDAPEETHP